MTMTLLTIFSFFTAGASSPLPPVERDAWLIPADDDGAAPWWGIKDGIGVTVPTQHGPRGLIGIQTPYLGLPGYQTLNFVSVEPMVDGQRGYSEMEHSNLDNVQGLRLWVTDDIEPDAQPPAAGARPPKGKIETVDGVQVLSLYVHVEPMSNGARPIVQVILRADKPYEVAFKTFTADGSAKMDSCVLSSTCGNYQRLRILRLKDKEADALKLWEGEQTPDHGFLSPRSWSLNELVSDDKGVVVCAESDETDPAAIDAHWKYAGAPAKQYWRCPKPSEKLVCRVNARETYYGSQGAKIPGGRAFENFELEDSFREGQEFIFGAPAIR